MQTTSEVLEEVQKLKQYAQEVHGRTADTSVAYKLEQVIQDLESVVAQGAAFTQEQLAKVLNKAHDTFVNGNVVVDV